MAAKAGYFKSSRWERAVGSYLYLKMDPYTLALTIVTSEVAGQR
jgi:hypothetical protein